MSALWPLDGGARNFFLCVLGGAVAHRHRAGRLHFSHGLRDAEPDALKKMATLPGASWNHILECLKEFSLLRESARSVFPSAAAP